MIPKKGLVCAYSSLANMLQILIFGERAKVQQRSSDWIEPVDPSLTTAIELNEITRRQNKFGRSFIPQRLIFFSALGKCVSWQDISRER